jgi:DNA polymerase-3 subunit delta'
LFRQALITNYGLKDLTHFVSQGDFDLEKFAPFVHNGNIFLIIKSLEDSFFHIERNGNAKMIFSELSLTLTRLIHTQPKSS